MAKILTFRNKDDGSSDQQFLTDENQTLSFRATEDGGISLGNLSGTGLTDLFPDPKKDWSNQELAELFRVRQLLSGANVPVETDRGVTDEGDPWFVFCHANGEVFIHLCRIDGFYLLDSPNVVRPLRGADFNELIADFTNQALPARGTDEETAPRVIRLERGGKVRLHPSAMLAALIWTLFLASEELVLLAPEDTPFDGDTLLDFDGLLAIDTTESDTIDVFFEDNTTDVANLLKDDLYPDDHTAPDAHGQLRETLLQQQQGLTVQNNAVTMGLSTIAIAMGFMSETVLLDNQRQVLESLKELGFSEYRADVRAIADLDTPEDAGSNALMEMLADFLGLDLSLNTNVADVPTTQADRAQLQVDLAEVTAEKATEAAAKGANKTAAIEIERDKAAVDEIPVNLVDTPANAPNLALPGKGDRDTLSTEAEQETTSLTLSQIVQTWKPDMEEFQLGQTTIKASFGVSETDAFALFSLFDMPTQGTASSLRDFDDVAKRLISFIEARDGNISFIELADEIIMVDRSAVTGGVTDFMQWEAVDGRTISFIGLAADFEQFEMIA